MSAKKTAKPELPNTITLTDAQKSLPEVKALLRRLKQEQEKIEMEKKLTPIVEFAGKTLGQSFKSWNQMVRFVEKLDKGSGRGGRITNDQKEKVIELLRTDKGNAEIAKEVGCKVTQVSSLRNRLKNSK